MNTNQIKKFACEARNILKRGIAAKITTLGFDAKGNVAESMMPQLIQGGSLWKGELYTEGFHRQWMALYHRVQQKGIQEVYEEAAYTWFNRLMAIRIMQKNGLCEPVLVYTNSARTPRIVDEARMSRMPQMLEETRTHLMELLDDDTKVTEQFALLISAWCHANPIMQACFGTLADYTELLLPQNILAEGGFVDMINHTEFITDEDFHSPELIGWLYQFYISERKDEVFAKKGKFEADEIPAATQIFTPNWIVKYMVQNTVGRIFLDNNPGPNPFKDKWKYLVDQEQQADENIYRYNELTDLKVADLACGSGHILNECFDILYDLYIYEGYTRSEAIENIFAHNLTGIDLDNRAKQLATFALMIKACQKDSSFIDAHVLPHVLTMPKPLDEEADGSVTNVIHEFFQGAETKQITKDIESAFKLMNDADSLGSIMKFDISESTRFAIVQTVDYWNRQSIVPQSIQDNMPAMELILTLTQKYSVLVANPPYMGRNTMNNVLTKYLDKCYPATKQDLYSTFMQLMLDKTVNNGRSAFVTMESWMFLSSFEIFRNNLLSKNTIESLIHMPYLGKGWTSMGINFGTDTCVIYKGKKDIIANYQYIRYFETSKETLKPLFFPTINERYSKKKQEEFLKIPGKVIGYWLSKKSIGLFDEDNIAKNLITREGMATADNERFLRNWHEVSVNKISCFNEKTSKWYPYNKGGAFRRWYGNRDYIVNWENNGFEIRNNIDKETGRVRSHNYNGEYAFKECITWSALSSGDISIRYCEEGFLWDSKGACGFSETSLLYILGLLNSKVARSYLNVLSPTIDYKVGDIIQIPLIKDNVEYIENFIKATIEISRLDWDAHETSWDFELNEIVKICNDKSYLRVLDNGKPLDISVTIEVCMLQYKSHWKAMFDQLHANEEELNRQFIEIYGLQNELTPDVPFNEITILQQGEITIENNELQWHDDVIVKQLISYAVGVWMGRYRLDKPGLHIAHPEQTDDELAPYTYGNETVTIDDDGIIPILPSGYSFDDNLCRRIADFVRIAFGADSLTENLNFMEKCLGTTIEQYVMKDFWKDHKRMYQNRPIYWLFSSKKGAFKCITYMHRMTPYTAEQVRSKYLLPYIEQLQARINDLESRAASLTTAETRHLTALKKIIEECQEYHERLQVVAEDTNITDFDLDDGVMVNYAKYGDVLQKLK